MRAIRPTSYPACSDGYRDGECWDQPVHRPVGWRRRRVGQEQQQRSRAATLAGRAQFAAVANEIVAEIDGALSDAQADELARRHGLARLQSQNFPLVGATIGLFRITDRRSMETVSREFAADTSVRSVQPNFRYVLQDQKAAPTEGDPAQYAVAKLRLPEAHKLAHGANVTIAVIDSGIDVKHPEFAGSIADSFDALGSKEGPHVHGTGVAGAIVAHARLMGSAPAARILAIRAFGTASSGAESTSFVILKGMDYAAAHGAQIVNMSFAGPKDALIERGIAASGRQGHRDGRRRRQCRSEIAAALSRRQPERDRGQRHRRPGQVVHGLEPRRLYRGRRTRRRHLPAGAGRKIPDDVGHLVFRGLCQRARGPDAGAQSGLEAG